jgi:hypothetical protein
MSDPSPARCRCRKIHRQPISRKTPVNRAGVWQGSWTVRGARYTPCHRPEPATVNPTHDPPRTYGSSDRRSAESLICPSLRRPPSASYSELHHMIILNQPNRVHVGGPQPASCPGDRDRYGVPRLAGARRSAESVRCV